MSNNLSDNNTVSKIKLVLIGNSAAGKTCIVQRMVNNIFNVNNSSTIGAAYMMYSINKNLKIEMWDTAGQERFYSLLPMYARGAEMIIIVVDIEKNIEEQFVKWSKYIENNKKLFLPHFKLFLIFNKYDLNTKFEIPNVILEQTQFIYISIVSAKSAHNIDKLKTYLEVVATKIVEERATHMQLHANTNSNGGNVGNVGNNSNIRDIGENKKDTIFGSKFSNMNINISEYGDKVKKYYDATHC
jgi:Ras-related protein Rab-5C